MAEESLYDRQGTRSEDSEAEKRTRQVQIREERIDEERKIRLLCEVCVGERPSVSEHLSWRERRSVSEHWFKERMSVYLCFDCVMYVCRNCLARHRSHRGMKVGRKEREREMEGEVSGSNRMKVQYFSERIYTFVLRKKAKRMPLEEENERDKEREKSERMEKERERKISLLLDDLMRESKTERMKKFESSRVRIYDRVYVKHELDRSKKCGITGLCVLENTGWVACDYINHCIKIFSLGSNVLQRYIRVVEAGPHDVTEIFVNQNSTEPNLESGSRSEVSVTARAEQDKHCLVAVTLPFERKIVFIDLSKKPALLHKVIHTEERCWAIKFYDGKIFTVCVEDRLDAPVSVYIKSTDGVTINKFDIGSYGDLPGHYLAVVSGRVYLTDMYNDKVQCRNVEGQLINEITIKGSRPAGIGVDPDNNVYLCAWKHNRVYKLDADLTRYKSVLHQIPGYIEEPWALCYYRDQLFISHYMSPSLYSYVTVFGLL